MKKTLTFKNVALAVFFSLPLFINAQNAPKNFGRSIANKPNPTNGLIRCISSEYESFLQENDPNRAKEAQFESWVNNKITERRVKKTNQKSGNTILTIPVVVHIIHNGDALGSGENIRNDQVLSQIEVLNQDYRRAFETPGYNEDAVGADTEIEFCLAKIDPDGNPTNGIDRVKFANIASWSESQVEATLKPQTQWDPEKYLNIWVCRFGGDLEGVLGYAQFPEGSGLAGLTSTGFDFTDGVVIGYQYFGSSDIYPQGTYQAPYDKGRTATHEIGHYLGLRHIWGDGQGCNNTDYCNDTPFAYEENSECYPGIDSCPNKPGEDMTNNYMDYTYDSCMNIFTLDQKERMITVLENADRRASLLTSGVCGLLTTADFEALRETTVYPNPAQNELNISVADGNLPDSYVIYNTLGQTVANVKVGDQSALTVNTSAYANGIYIIKIFKGNESKTIKFIKN